MDRCQIYSIRYFAKRYFQTVIIFQKCSIRKRCGQFLSPFSYQNSNRIHNTSFIRAVQIARVTAVLKQPIRRIDQTAMIRAGLREESRNNPAFFAPRADP